MESDASAVSVLQVDKLRVAYGKALILDQLDLSIRPSEIFGLLGPNGSGKTTLIRSICGRIRPTSGMIKIDGTANTSRAAIRRIGLVPQEIALYQHLTIYENLVAFGRLAGLSRHETAKALPFALDAAQLASRANDPVHTLSGGWKRRANIAAAILHRPALLILDEPTVGIDIDARAELHTVIKNLSDGGLAVLLATHDLDQAEVLCGRVGFLREGRLDPTGSPTELLNRMFSGSREVLIRLFAPALGGERDGLVKIGFAERLNGLEWSGLIHATGREEAELMDAFHQSALRIKEVVFREPGLDALFLALKRGGAHQ